MVLIKLLVGVLRNIGLDKSFYLHCLSEGGVGSENVNGVLLADRIEQYHFVFQRLGLSLVDVIAVIVRSELVEHEPAAVTGFGDDLGVHRLMVIVAPVYFSDQYRLGKLHSGFLGVVLTVPFVAEVFIDNALFRKLAGLGVYFRSVNVKDVFLKSFLEYALGNQHTVFLTSDRVFDADTVFDIFELDLSAGGSLLKAVHELFGIVVLVLDNDLRKQLLFDGI